MTAFDPKPTFPVALKSRTSPCILLAKSALSAARMSGSGLHASFALTAAMPVLVLVMRVWNVLARVLMVFQDALLTFISPQCRIGADGFRGLPRLVFLHHRKSFRDGHGIQPPECRSVADVRFRVLGDPEISTDGYVPHPKGVDLAFDGKVSHGIVDKQTVFLAGEGDGSEQIVERVAL